MIEWSTLNCVTCLPEISLPPHLQNVYIEWGSSIFTLVYTPTRRRDFVKWETIAEWFIHYLIQRLKQPTFWGRCTGHTSGGSGVVVYIRVLSTLILRAVWGDQGYIHPCEYFLAFYKGSNWTLGSGLPVFALKNAAVSSIDMFRGGGGLDPCFSRGYVPSGTTTHNCDTPIPL